MKQERRGAAAKEAERLKASAERRNAALKSKRKAARETLADARARYRHGHRDWPMVLVRAMVDNATKFKGESPFSVRAAIAASRVSAFDAVWNKLLREGKAGANQDPQPWCAARDELIKRLRVDPPESHWQRLLADFERAVLAGDANWFEGQAKAISFNDTRSNAEKARACFEVAVIREYELTPADVTPQNLPQHVLDRLDKRERYVIRQRRDDEKYGGIDQSKKAKALRVEGYPFASPRRCRGEITRIIDRYRSQYLSGQEHERTRQTLLLLKGRGRASAG